MKKGLWLIFKCQNCGKVFQEKPPKGMAGANYREIAKHIGAKTHIVSTHECKAGVFGCAKLIGCQIWEKQIGPAMKGGKEE